jgi:uncharacterized repeat protein (TIGR01451 family)
MKKLTLWLVATILFAGSLSAQVTVSLPQINLSSDGGTVTVPVNVTNFQGIGAFSLKISYDPNVLTFQSTPNPLGGNFIINTVGGVLSIGWFGLDPLSVNDGKLLDLEFTHIAGSTDLNFITDQCEVNDKDANQLNTTYINGRINGQSPNNPVGSIGGRAWVDLNKNGLQDSGEPGLQWVTVELYDCDGVKKDWKMTDADGKYLFENVAEGSYFVKFYLIDNNSVFTFTAMNVGGDDAIDSDVYKDSDTTGRTDCFAMAAGQSKFNVDAGVIDKPIDNNTGSIGNFVWIDGNGNGIQDAGETGLTNVTINLLDCSGTLLSTTISDPNGFYSFTNLIAGSYIVQFVPKAGFIFSPKNQGGDGTKDSDANETTGKTDCITLAEGINDMTVDAGMIQEFNDPDPGTAVVWVKKDDGLDVMPAIDEFTTYSITFANEGDAPVYDVTITDAIPAGTMFESCDDGNCEETFTGSNTYVFNIGTLNPGENGEVKITVKVVNFEPEYTNIVCLRGTDANQNQLELCDTDVNMAPSSTSGGGDSGVESRGDMAELLLKRQLKIQYGMTTPILAKSSGMSVSSSISLKDLVPPTGPFQSVPVETTPFDILGISNAIESYAVDYNAYRQFGVVRVGAIFATITEAPKIYDHTKAVCDRLGGYDVDNIQLVNIDGHPFYISLIRNNEKRFLDYSISFSVYETPSGLQLENKWNYSDFHAPAGASNVFNIQIWSNTKDGTIQLTEDVIARFKQNGNVSYMSQNLFNPDIFIKSARYTHDGNVHLNIVNKAGTNRVVLKTNYRVSQGDNLLETSAYYTAYSGENQVVIPVGIVSDAQIHMSQTVGFSDEVYVSGGAYTYLTGPNSIVSEFETANYPQQLISNYPAGSVLLAGGAYTSGVLNDWVSVMRSLTTTGSAYNLSGHTTLRFKASGNGVLQVIFDLIDTQNFNYYSTLVYLSGETKEYAIDFSEFKLLNGNPVPLDASKIRNIGFVLSSAHNPGLSNFKFDINSIAFTGNSTTAVDPGEQVIPDKFKLEQNYPNPFNPSTVIKFSVANREMITLKVYNLIGQEIATLVKSELEPGTYTATFDASKLSSGVYFYQLTGNSVNITKKMILTK